MSRHQLFGRAAAAAVVLSLGSAASAEVITFNDFESATAGQQSMFRQPSFSGSTSSNLVGGAAADPNIQRVTTTFPAGNAGAGAQALETSFAFVDTALTRWLRMTTNNAPGVPNPAIDLNQPLNFDVYSTVPVSLSLLIRETGGSGPIGSNGGTANGIEFVGATSFAGSPGGASAGPVGQTIPANQWTTLTFNIPEEPVRGFAGTTANSELTGDWGVLEALAITSTGEAGPITLYFDNFSQGVIPEPATAGVLGLAAVALLARRRRA